MAPSSPQFTPPPKVGKHKAAPVQQRDARVALQQGLTTGHRAVPHR